MIFPVLQTEAKVQVDDMTRLDASRSYTVDEEAITAFEIQPETGGDFYDCMELRYLDWQYATAGTKTVTVRITTDGSPVTKTGTLSVLSVAEDKLFSQDSDLQTHETDILRFLKVGRNSYLDIHRRAQVLILDWINKMGYRDDFGQLISTVHVVDIEELRQWSTFMALKMIFSGIQNDSDDFFKQKARQYEGEEKEARQRLVLRLDLNKDGVINDTGGESLNPVQGGRLYRR